MTKVYLAARMSHIMYMEVIANELERLGSIRVVSRWIRRDNGILDRVDAAQTDIEDMDNADVIICFSSNDGDGTGVGRHFEAGYGYGKGKKVIIVGEKETVFHYLPNIFNVPLQPEGGLIVNLINAIAISVSAPPEKRKIWLPLNRG